MKDVDFLLNYLFAERGQKYVDIAEGDKFRTFRSLVNVRPPQPASDEFYAAESRYLSALLSERGVTEQDDIAFDADGIALWQGDITTLAVDAIVNAANSQMLGCFAPCHGCIDNAIHTFAGVRLRSECFEIMQKQGFDEPTGTAKITDAYNLPCKRVIHTVGPIVVGRLTPKHERQLASCYESCLKLAAENDLQSVAFCCISTGVFNFPRERAAEIAVATVKKFLAESQRKMKVVFNVFKEEDHAVYKRLLG